jgi:protein-tyrosine phosphatase
MRDLLKIMPYVSRGCLLQITAASIANRFGDLAFIRAKEMLEQDWVHIIATDAHNRQHRPPDLAAGRYAAEKIVGEEQARRLVVDNPKEIIETTP